MNAGSSLAFPGGRTLAAWWRQLAPHHPQHLRVGYLSLQRIEAPASCRQPHRLPADELLILKALHLHGPSAAAALHLDAGLVVRVRDHLRREGLVTGTFVLTDLGRQLLERGEYARQRRQRRSFFFWCDPSSAQVEARFVHVPRPERISWLPPAAQTFDVEHLRRCVQQTHAWKQQHEFPLDVQELISPPSPTLAAGLEDVTIAFPLRFFGVVIRPAGAEAPWMAFEVQVRNWELHAGQPALALPDDAGNWLSTAANAEAWQASFAEWCQQRQISHEDAARCELRQDGIQLHVTGPAAVMSRVSVAKGENWLMAGAGLMRAAARLEPPAT